MSGNASLQTSLLARLRTLWSGLTIEPLAFLAYVAIFATDMSTPELYLRKACQVNLGHSAELCANLTQPEYNLTQTHTQEYVAGVQAHNSILQKVPAIVFTLFAGPLSDTYGRKPLIILTLLGIFVQNFVFLFNAIWFVELKVEFLLFECLQDLTGGRDIFLLAVSCYIMDISSQDTRTARMCILDALITLGVMTGSPLGTMIKSSHGYISLYTFNLVLMAVILIYSAFIKDSIVLVSDERRKAIEEDKQAADIKCLL